MLGAEAVCLLFVYCQPPFVGLLLFILGYRRLLVTSNLAVLGLLRQRRPGVRAFECAVAGRLGLGGLGPQGGMEGPYQAFVALLPLVILIVAATGLLWLLVKNRK